MKTKIVKFGAILLVALFTGCGNYKIKTQNALKSKFPGADVVRIPTSGEMYVIRTQDGSVYFCQPDSWVSYTNPPVALLLDALKKDTNDQNTQR